MNIRDLKNEDMNLTVWRYMPFTKFISILVYQAIWFSKMNILQDQFEGMMPQATKDIMQAHFQELKKDFNPEFHSQFDEMASRNEQDSRELLIVNCWFIDDYESNHMWREYGGGKESIAIRSTVKQLIENICVLHDNNTTHIGRVAYVDHEKHLMTEYHASQGYERAFLKDAERFQCEQELRIVTLNVKTKNCVSPEGRPYNDSDIQGKNMNNFENPGLYVAIFLKQLVSEIRISPEADDWFYLLMKRIIEQSNLGIVVLKSELSSS